jgi:hypothetical protein
MAFEMTQFGGYKSSTAGDCALVSLGDWHVFVDLGKGANKAQTRWALEEWRDRTQSRANFQTSVVITHPHGDHTGDPPAWNELSQAKLYFNAAHANASLLQELCQTFPNRTQVVRNGHELSPPVKLGPLTCYFTIILPNGPTKDENDTSMGVLVEVLHESSDTPKFACLSLGDMTPSCADNAVASVLESHGYLGGPNQLTVVKLAHHGSEKNLLPVLGRVITAETRLVISGYTMIGTETLRSTLQQWAPKACIFLFAEQSYAAEFAALQGARLIAKDQRLGLAQRYTMSVNNEGVFNGTAHGDYEELRAKMVPM